jgi:hypothetical protein
MPCASHMERRVLLDAGKLERRFGELVTVNAIRARVRCKGCGKRTKAVRIEVEDSRR